MVSLQKQLSSSALGTRITHKEESLTLIIIISGGQESLTLIIIISGGLIHQQEGNYFQNNTTTIFSSNFKACLVIFIEIVDFRHTVQTQDTWVPEKLQS